MEPADVKLAKIGKVTKMAPPVPPLTNETVPDKFRSTTAPAGMLTLVLARNLVTVPDASV